MDDIARRYRKFDTSLISDALNQHGVDGVIAGLSPISPDHVAVGRATTFRFERVDSDERTNFPHALFDAMEPDRLLVMDAIPDTSCWGGMASRLADNFGVTGLVTDGSVRDADDIRAGDFPVFSAGTTPRTGQRRTEIAVTNEPVNIGGVTVAPDDVVVADLTGVVVVPGDEVCTVAETAEEMLAEELLIERKVDAGATHEDLRDYEF